MTPNSDTNEWINATESLPPGGVEVGCKRGDHQLPNRYKIICSNWFQSVDGSIWRPMDAPDSWRHKAEAQPVKEVQPPWSPCDGCEDHEHCALTERCSFCAVPAPAQPLSPEDEFKAMIENWDPLTSDERKSINDYFWSHFPPPPAAHLPTVSAVTDEAVVDDEIVDAWRNSLTTKEAVNKLRHIFARDTAAAKAESAASYRHAEAESNGHQRTGEQLLCAQAEAAKWKVEVGHIEECVLNGVISMYPHDSAFSRIRCCVGDLKAERNEQRTLKDRALAELTAAREQIEKLTKEKDEAKKEEAGIKAEFNRAWKDMNRLLMACQGRCDCGVNDAIRAVEALTEDRDRLKAELETEKWLSEARCKAIGKIAMEQRDEAIADLNRTKSLLNHERLIAANKAKREAPKDWPMHAEISRAYWRNPGSPGWREISDLFTDRHNALMAEKDVEVEMLKQSIKAQSKDRLADAEMHRDTQAQLTEAGKLIAEAGGIMTRAIACVAPPYPCPGSAGDILKKGLAKLQAWGKEK